MAEITIYKNCKITQEKNFIVEDIESYLETLQTIPFLQAQYIKNANQPDLTIKVALDETNLIDTESLNYLSINETSKKRFYFVINKKWTSKNCIELTLKMDVLNTFKIDIDYSLSNKTHILREHKDRIKYEGSKFSYDDEIEQIEDDVQYRVVDKRHKTLQPQSIITISGLMAIVVKNKNNGEAVEKFRAGLYNIKCNVDAQKYTIESGIVNYYTLAYGSNDYVIEFIGRNITCSNIFSSIEGYYKKVYRRIVDKTSEGITPVLYGEEKGELREDDDQDYYLIYRATEEYVDGTPKPVDVMLASDSEQQFTVAKNGISIKPSDLTDNKQYYFTLAVGNTINSAPSLIGTKTKKISIPFVADGDSYNMAIESVNEEKNIYRQVIIAMKKSGSSIEWYLERYNRYNYYMRRLASGIATEIVINTDHIILNEVDTVKLDLDNLQSDASYNTIELFDNETETITTKPFSVLDRSDSKLISIIQLPYRPVDSIDRFKASPDSTAPFLILDAVNSPKGFNSLLEFVPEYNYQDDLIVENLVISDLRNDEIESKIYHSDFYRPQFIYDNFSFTFQNELLNNANLNNETFNVEFAVANNSSSKMAFRFPDYQPDELTQNYNILCIDRNNSISLYNSNYFNYMKLGYNVDVKQKNENLTKNILTGVGSLAGGILSLAFGSKSVGASAVVAGVGLIATAVGKTASTIISQVESERAIADKINQLKQQGSSISGSDDVSIFNFYSNNRAKMMVYKVSEKMQKLLLDLFYYSGYACDYQNTPSLNSRKWFNFLQCEPDYTFANFTETNKIELTAKFNSGITLLHVNIIGGVKTWDFEQIKENIETSLNV